MAKHTTPNHKLRAARKQRGWSQQYVADAIIGLPGGKRTVGRWERGVAFPQPHYRQKLCQLFNKNLDELGLLRKAKETISPDTSQNVMWKLSSSLLDVFVGRQNEMKTITARLCIPEVRLGNKPLIGLALDSLADLAFFQCQYERATELYQEYIRLAVELGDRPITFLIRLKLADIALQKGDIEQGIILVQEALLFFSGSKRLS